MSTTAVAKNTKKVTQASDAQTIALHGKAGSNHFVGIGNLRVIICNESGHWFAQGLEIDYAADGNSFADVKKNFETGLKGTIGLHLQSYGKLDNLLKVAPPEAWNEMLKDGKKMRHTQVSFHTVMEEQIPVDFPFGAIDYLERNAA